MNATMASSSVCGKLPFNQTNAIQPHGVLVVTDAVVNELLQVSDNIQELTGLLSADVVAQPADILFTAESLKQLRQVAIYEKPENKIPLELGLCGLPQNVLCLLHTSNELVIIEILLPAYFAHARRSFIDSFQYVRKINQVIDSCGTVEEVCDTVTRQLRKCLGYDKIMIYRFDDEWNGSVIAEDAIAEMERYLGLTFPESDIPRPVRNMYQSNPYRLIPDRDYLPVKLYPILNPLTNGFTNLSHADLRSVAGVHVEYLKNMDVMASLSVRIMVNGQLWGLIACHHTKPKYLDYYQCAELELISNSLGSRIQLLEAASVAGFNEKLTKKYTCLIEKLISCQNFIDGISGHLHEVMDFFDAGGVVFSWDGVFFKEGQTPFDADLETLQFWLKQKVNKGLFYDHKFPLQFNQSPFFSACASGILVLPIQPHKGHYLIVFRPELVSVIAWGGDPRNTVHFEPGSDTYHPRHSFEIWKESIYNTALRWRPEEIVAAEKLESFILQHILNHFK